MVEIPDETEDSLTFFANPNKASGPGTNQIRSCYVAVWHPSQNPSTPWVGVQGQRAGCSHTAGFRLELYKERPGIIPDKYLSGTGGHNNMTIRTAAKCAGNGRYYGKVVTDYRTTVTSDKIRLC